ncbi:actin remodeling regulator NHS isoform X2 [Osmerus eperlanus]|uniref:actin remodeling regulator NHS isoform X2 n=1 Tax=Osmerus eperlanus TaxID=29151 RepID=UPI002E0F476F
MSAELHQHAQHSLKPAHLDRQRASSRERRVTISISVATPTSSYPSPREQRPRSLTTAAALSDHDEGLVSLGQRPRCPVPNTPSTLDKQTNWPGALPLPTPEERMRGQGITSCLIPINVTGVGFDREASVRGSLVPSQSLLQRRRKLRRRRTIAGIPRQLQQDLDSDESPGSRERTVIVHADPALCDEDLSCRHSTKDSGCQTDDLPGSSAPSRRRLRAQRGQAASVPLSRSTGNISSLPDGADAMFSSSVGARLRSRSLPREGGCPVDEGRDDSDEDDEEEELSPFEAEDFLSGPRDFLSGPGELKEEEEGSTDDQALSGLQLGCLKYQPCPGSPESAWLDRSRSRLPGTVDMGSCEISSSSDTFSSPVHSSSTTGVLGGAMVDHKDDHQSSSGNWSGSSSTCPSQTSETLPPAASPPLTGSSHCDSELSLNAATHPGDDPGAFLMDGYHGDRLGGPRTQRTGSFSSTAMDLLEDAGVGTASEGEWGYPPHPDPRCPQDFSPDQGLEAEGSLGCPSFTSMATYESFSDKPPSEKDSASHYSVDTEGYYTSMHFDCGLKGSKSFTYNYAAAGRSDSQTDLSGHLTLGRRCLSLRKTKAKPSPPRRSSSLRKISSEVKPSEEDRPKITSVQQLLWSSMERKLQPGMASPSTQREGPPLGLEPLEAWGVAGRHEIQDSGLFGSTDTHSFKDQGAVQSDYADLWLLNDLRSNSDPYRSLSNSSTATGTTVIECVKSQESSESLASQPGSRPTTPSLPSADGDFKLASPDKLAGLASPSSGYSSQSETPTSSFPSAFFPGPLSPSCGKRKPKVPERKSSLSSLQPTLTFSSKRQLELPVIPPTHLDLSSLHNVVCKPSAHRNQVHALQQSKQKAATAAWVTPKAEGQAKGAAKGPDSIAMAITPMVLRSVQLRAVGGKQGEASPDVAAKPKCPTVNIIAPPSSSKPPAYSTHLPPSQDHYPPPAGAPEGPLSGDPACHEEVTPSQDKQSSFPIWGVSPSLPDSDLTRADVPECTSGGEGEERKTRATSKELLSVSSSCESDLNQPPGSDPAEEPPAKPAASSAPQPSPAHRPSVLHQVPDLRSLSEASQAYPISDGGSRDEGSGPSGDQVTRSALQEIREGSPSPDTEEDFRKESPPSDRTGPPQDEEDSVFLSPNKTRTTEDLFAMIHRSKRKVLGRKDSGELGTRGRLGAASCGPPPSHPALSPSTPPPPLPPASPATPTGPQKPPGPIYRSARKSSTSNEEFKLLLLKKGSRSDSSYRMSATEILKSPIAPKPPGDVPLEGGQCLAEEPASPLSPLSPRGPDPLHSPPRTGAEGFSPKALPPSVGSRQGRSRIPPPANSSRFGNRSRHFTAPMQAISEGETENSDGSPHDDRSSQGSA